MWLLYAAISAMALFIAVERIPKLRQYSPVQSCVFMPQPGTVNLTMPGVHQFSSHKYDTPIVYFYNPPSPSLNSSKSSTILNRPNGIVLYLHGNASNIIGSKTELLAIQAELNNKPNTSQAVNYHAVAMEYPGYGTDVGSCRVADHSIADRAIALLVHLSASLDVQSENIIVVGRSIGTGIAAQVASKMSLKALVLISPFTRLKDVVGQIVGGVSCLMGERFDTMALIPKIKVPLLCIHGTADALIPISHSHMLVERHEKSHMDRDIHQAVVELNGDHNSISIAEIAGEIACFVP